MSSWLISGSKRRSIKALERIALIEMHLGIGKKIVA
jgi:hypothetical protein